ncbi:hypothetical protein D3C72_120430 [compost metagenome]
MHRFQSFFMIVMAAAMLFSGCMAPLGPRGSLAGPELGPIGFFDVERGAGAIAVRLVDPRLTTQALDAADPAYNAVRFELQNSAKLKDAKVIGVEKQLGGTYAAVFTGLPSDAQARYTLRASLYKEIATPTNLLDAGYANLDNKVGEGTSAPFSLTPGESKAVTLTINALGPITLTSSLPGFMDVSIFELGDTSAGFSTSLVAASNPGATHVTYAFYPFPISSGVPIGPLTTVVAGAWTGTSNHSFSLPPTLGIYNFVMEMYAGGTLLSRRIRQVFVAEPRPRVTVTGFPPALVVNGDAWDPNTVIQKAVSVTVNPQFWEISVTNSTMLMLWAKVGTGSSVTVPPFSTMSLLTAPGTHTVTLSQSPM